MSVPPPTPALSPPVPDDDELLERVQRDYKRGREHQGLWRKEARRDYDFYAGEQWDAEARNLLSEQQRPAITFNRIAPIIDAIVGYEINNRQETRFIPRTQGDAGPNELLTNAAEWVQDECDADTEDSAVFRDAVVSGMGWSETRLVDDISPDMDIVRERVDPLEMAWDPTARKPNLTDMRWLLRERFYTKDQFNALFPEADLDVETMDTWENAIEDENEGETTRFGYTDDKQVSGDAKKGTIRVWEYQWKETVNGYKAVNPLTGKTEEISTAVHKQVQQTVKEGILPPVQSAKIKRTVVMRCFVAGGQVLEKGPAPCPDSFTYVCVTGKHDRNRNLWYGVVRSLRDPQEWQNKWLSQSMHIMNTNAKGGVMVETSAVADPQKFEQSWADSAAVTWVEAGGMQKIQPKPMGQIPAATDRLLQLAMQAFGEVSGVNAEMMGMADRDQPGILEHQRKQAAVTILAPLFDSLRRYRKINGRLLMYFIRTYISDGRLIRVSERGMEQYIPLIRDDQTIEYDVIVDQSATSPNEKERVFGILQAILPMIKDMVTPPVMMELLNYTPLPESLLAKLKQLASQPNPDADEAKKVDARAKNAKAANDETKALLNVAQARQTGMETDIDAASAALGWAGIPTEAAPQAPQPQPGQPMPGQPMQPSGMPIQ